MKSSVKQILLSAIMLIALNNVSFSQAKDSIRYKNPTNIPDTQRVPPHRFVPDDSSSKKLEGGALIDSNATKRTNDVDDKKPKVKKPKH